MNSPLRVGVIGYGFASATFHVPLVNAVSGLELSAVSTSDPAKVRAALPHVAIDRSPQELLARPDIDLVIIPTPNDSHYPLAVQALSAGKHVVIDKPFTVTVAEAEDLVSRARRAQRLLTVFQSRRWDSDFLTVQALLRSEELGRVTHFESHIDRFRPQVRARWREGSGLGSGLWYDLGPHLIDQALVLFGDPESLSLHQARARDGALSDDWFHAILDYGPLRVILHASVVAADPGPRYLIHGTTGSFVKSGMDPQEEALKAGGIPGGPGWGVDPSPGSKRIPGQPPLVVPGVPGAYQRFYEAVRDAIEGRGPGPVSTEEALRVMRWIEAGRRSADEGRLVHRSSVL